MQTHTKTAVALHKLYLSPLVSVNSLSKGKGKVKYDDSITELTHFYGPGVFINP
jgi:hypothetical protein